MGYDMSSLSRGLGATQIDGSIKTVTTYRGKPRLQLATIPALIKSGRSGSPVWCNNQIAVVGVIDICAEELEHTQGLAIPIDAFNFTGFPISTTYGVLIDVPYLPRYYLPRNEYLNEAKENLLDRKPGKNKICIVGTVGVGKSVLATAIAHDKGVQQEFKDCILWISLGRDREPRSGEGLTQKQIVQWQSKACYSLDKGYPQFDDPNRGKLTLGNILSDRACLLILDDVWDMKQIEMFDALGQNCAMLITTRCANIVKNFRGYKIYLSKLSEKDAINLLAKWAGQEVESLPEEAYDIAEACGSLPVNLAAIGASLRGEYLDTNRWRSVLDDIRSPSRLKKIESMIPQYPYSDSLVTVQVSIEALERKVQILFLELAVFPENTPIPEEVLINYWSYLQLQENDIKDIINLIVDRSLAQRDQYGRINLHELYFDYIRSQVKNLQALHRRFLGSNFERTKNGQWCTLLDDGYIYAHLVWHMQNAGFIQKIHDLLIEETSRHENGWYEVRESAGQTAGFIDDVSIAWQLAEETSELAIKKGDLAPSVGLEIRYALILSSINSLAQNLPRALLIGLVDSCIWTPNQGLTYASHIPDARSRSKTLIELGHSLKDEQIKNEAFKKAELSDKESPFRWQLDNDFVWYMEHLRKDTFFGQINLNTDRSTEKQLEAALNAALELENSYWRAAALAELADNFSGEKRNDILKKALAAARKINDQASRNKTIEILEISRNKTGEVLNAAGKKRQNNLDPQRVKVYHEWRDNLHKLAHDSRENLLKKFDDYDFRTKFIILGGEQAIAEVMKAVVDVGFWWP
jgi:hypothetical protein